MQTPCMQHTGKTDKDDTCRCLKFGSRECFGYNLLNALRTGRGMHGCPIDQANMFDGLSSPTQVLITVHPCALYYLDSIQSNSINIQFPPPTIFTRNIFKTSPCFQPTKCSPCFFCHRPGGWKKKSIVRHVYFLDWTPFCPPPPPPTPPSSAPTQTKGVPICSSLNFAFICILKLVKFKAREMLRAKK